MKKDWDGEGLPQAGQRVRIVTAEGDQGCADVVAHHMGGLVVWQHSNMDYRRWHADFIRPVMTIEEMSIIQIMKDAELMRVQAERVYQAGYRKELEQ